VSVAIGIIGFGLVEMKASAPLTILLGGALGALAFAVMHVL